MIKMGFCPFCLAMMGGSTIMRIKNTDSTKRGLQFFFCGFCERVFEVNPNEGSGQDAEDWVADMPPATMRWRERTHWDRILSKKKV